MKKLLPLIAVFCVTGSLVAQTNVPITQLPSAPDYGTNDVLVIVYKAGTTNAQTRKITTATFIGPITSAYSNLVNALSNYTVLSITGTNAALSQLIANNTTSLAALSNAAGITFTSKDWTTSQRFNAGLTINAWSNATPLNVVGTGWSITGGTNLDAGSAPGGMIVGNDTSVHLNGANAAFIAQEQGTNALYISQSSRFYETNGLGILAQTINTLSTGPNFGLALSTTASNFDLSMMEVTAGGAHLTNLNATLGKFGDGRLIEFWGIPVLARTNTGTLKTNITAQGEVHYGTNVYYIDMKQ